MATLDELISSGQYDRAWDYATSAGMDPSQIASYVNQHYGTNWTGDELATSYGHAENQYYAPAQQDQTGAGTYQTPLEAFAYDPTGQYRRRQFQNTDNTGENPRSFLDTRGTVQHLVNGTWQDLASPHEEESRYQWAGLNDPRYAAAVESAQSTPSILDDLIASDPGVIGQLNYRTSHLDYDNQAFNDPTPYLASRAIEAGYGDQLNPTLRDAAGWWNSYMSPESQSKRSDIRQRGDLMDLMSATGMFLGAAGLGGAFQGLGASSGDIISNALANGGSYSPGMMESIGNSLASQYSPSGIMNQLGRSALTQFATTGKFDLEGLMRNFGTGFLTNAAGAATNSFLDPSNPSWVNSGITGAVKGGVRAGITGRDFTQGLVGGGISGVTSDVARNTFQPAAESVLRDFGVNEDWAKSISNFGTDFGAGVFSNGIMQNIYGGQNRANNIQNTVTDSYGNPTNTNTNTTTTTTDRPGNLRPGYEGFVGNGLGMTNWMGQQQGQQTGPSGFSETSYAGSTSALPLLAGMSLGGYDPESGYNFDKYLSLFAGNTEQDPQAVPEGTDAVDPNGGGKFKLDTQVEFGNPGSTTRFA